MVTIGVLALQGDVREHISALEHSGAAAMPVRRPGELDAVDGLVIHGGESTTIKFSTSKLQKGGDYTFFCSVPGHWSLMKGKLAFGG